LAGNGQFIAAQGNEGAIGVNVYFMSSKLTKDGKTAQELFVVYGVVIRQFNTPVQHLGLQRSYSKCLWTDDISN